MTDLQVSLMAIGGTILLGVIFFNKWQEYKTKRSVERSFSSMHDDVLMTRDDTFKADNAKRFEPSFVSGTDGEIENDQSRQELDASNSTVTEHKQVIEDVPAAATPSEPPASVTPAVQDDLSVDELIDCVIPIAFESPVRGDKLLALTQTLRKVGSREVRYIGLRHGGVWEELASSSMYSSLRVGVQLANRYGTLNEIEYSELVMRLRQVADQLDAEPDVPDMISVMQTARELHQFLGEYDAKLSVNVHSNGAPWAINSLLPALERQGFDLQPDGRLVMPDGDTGTLFTLSTNVNLSAATTSRLTLLLDVACVHPSMDGFGAMIACARALAARLDGTVVDDSNQVLSNTALAEIAEQVRVFYSHMEESAVSAGSIRALRLFC